MKVARALAQDSLLLDDDGLVLQDNRVLRLGPIAVAVWRATAEPREVDDLTQLLITEFGAPPDDDPTAATRAILDELVTTGVLREVGQEAAASEASEPR